MGFTFPSSDLDRPTALLNLLGSFWANSYHARDQVLSYAMATGQAAKQTELNLLEAIAAVSRFTVPIFHQDNWYMLRILKSQRNTADTSLLRYDDPNVAAAYNGLYQYDVPLERTVSAYPGPAKLADVTLIMNRITSPSVSLVKTVDFIVDDVNSAIVFNADPFDNPGFATSPVFEDGVQTDTELVLWLFQAQFDFNRIFRQFAYVLNLRMTSSSSYRDLMNAIFNAVVGGPTRKYVELAFQAMTGIILAQTTGEIVEQVTSDAQNKIVVTNLNVYKYNLDASVLVAEGDKLVAGQPIIDGLEVIAFNRGDAPASLRAVSLGRGMLAAGFLGDVVFENKQVALIVDETDPSGYTKLSWELGGFELDVEKFFDDLHARGVAAGETLAMLLDQRTVKDGQPTAFNLPTTINPLEFLITNVLRNNAFLVRVKVSEAVAGGCGLESVRFLRRMIQPHTAMILLFELTGPAESVTVDLVDDNPGFYTGLEPAADSVTDDLAVDRVPGLRLISECCQ